MPRSAPVLRLRAAFCHRWSAQQTSQDPNNLTMPTSPSKSDQAKMDKLARLSGTDFDKVFAREMVKDHRTDIRAFECDLVDQ
jgi:predicted outer membrane protein